MPSSPAPKRAPRKSARTPAKKSTGAPARAPATSPAPAAPVAPAAAVPPPAPAAPMPAPAWTAAPPAAPAVPAASPLDERQYAMFVHLAALSGILIPLGNVFGPLILWLVKKDQSAFVDRHGCAALNFQMSFMLYAVAAVILFFVLGLATLGIGFLVLLPLIIILAIVAAVLEIVFPILAALAANRGQEYRYPLSITFLRPAAERAPAFTPV